MVWDEFNGEGGRGVKDMWLTELLTIKHVNESRLETENSGYPSSPSAETLLVIFYDLFLIIALSLSF